MLKRLVRKLSGGLFFWIVFFFFIGCLFILNKDTIKGVLDKTRATYLFFKTPAEGIMAEGKTEMTEMHPIPLQPLVERVDSIGRFHDDGDAAAVLDDNTVAVALASAEAAHQKAAKPSNEAEGANHVDSAAADSTIVDGISVQMRSSTLYWIQIDADGTILRHAKTHLIPQSDSPLTDSLMVLLAQSSVGQEKDGMISLIPAGTKLRSVRVKDGVAFIDFSDEFQFNQYGIEGYLAQLAQVVFTATEFSTVDAVQFLIEGQKKEYLGSEGVWIGTPLTRNLF